MRLSKLQFPTYPTFVEFVDLLHCSMHNECGKDFTRTGLESFVMIWCCMLFTNFGFFGSEANTSLNSEINEIKLLLSSGARSFPRKNQPLTEPRTPLYE